MVLMIGTRVKWLRSFRAQSRRVLDLLDQMARLMEAKKWIEKRDIIFRSHWSIYDSNFLYPSTCSINLIFIRDHRWSKLFRVLLTWKFWEYTLQNRINFGVLNSEILIWFETGSVLKRLLTVHTINSVYTHINDTCKFTPAGHSCSHNSLWCWISRL